MIDAVRGKSIFRTVPARALTRLRGVDSIRSFEFGRNALDPALRTLLEREDLIPGEIKLDLPAKARLLAMAPTLAQRVEAGESAETIFSSLELSLFVTEEQNLYILNNKGNIAIITGKTLILTPREVLEMAQRGEMPLIGAMAEIPGGRYMLGDNKSSNANEKPEHIVEIDPFLMGVFSVTNAQFREAVKDGLYLFEQFWTAQGWQLKGIEQNGWTQPGFWGNEKYQRFNGDNQPVVGVSHYESFAYLIWKSLQEGVEVKDFLTGKFFDLDKIYDRTNQRWLWEGYRLPTEAEIEIAIRGGLIGEQYPWKEGLIGKAHFGKDKNTGATVAVNDPGFPPNGYGLRHAVGNVLIWGFDWCDFNYYNQLQAAGVIKNPIGPDRGSSRVIRGGTWYHTAAFLRVAIRGNYEPVMRRDNLGFRAARSIRND